MVCCIFDKLRVESINDFQRFNQIVSKANAKTGLGEHLVGFDFSQVETFVKFENCLRNTFSYRKHNKYTSLIK